MVAAPRRPAIDPAARRLDCRGGRRYLLDSDRRETAWRGRSPPRSVVLAFGRIAYGSRTTDQEALWRPTPSRRLFLSRRRCWPPRLPSPMRSLGPLRRARASRQTGTRSTPAVADPRVPDHATGIVSSSAPGGTLRLEGRVECLLVTGNRALLKGPILRPPSQAGQTLILGAVDRDVQGHSQVPDETGLRVVAPDFSCPGTVVAATEPLVQGDVVLWSPVPAQQPAGRRRRTRPGGPSGDHGHPRRQRVQRPGRQPPDFPLVTRRQARRQHGGALRPDGRDAHLRCGSPRYYVAQLIVRRRDARQRPDTAVISTVNSAPVANAGPDQETFVGRTVTLDGSASSDVDGDPLTFAWSLTSRPAGSTATFADPTAARPTFVADRPGSYVARLVVNDGTVNSAPDTVTISTLNSAARGARRARTRPLSVGHHRDRSTAVPRAMSMATPLTFQLVPDLRPTPGQHRDPLRPGAVMPTFVVDRPGNLRGPGSSSTTVPPNSAPDTVTISTVDSAAGGQRGPRPDGGRGEPGDPRRHRVERPGWRPAGVPLVLDEPAAGQRRRPRPILRPCTRRSSWTARANTGAARRQRRQGRQRPGHGDDQHAELRPGGQRRAGPDGLRRATPSPSTAATRRDVDGDPLTYAWSLIRRPRAAPRRSPTRRRDADLHCGSPGPTSPS